MNDNSLRQDILDELDYEPSLDAANIGVTVENGIVTLTGHVHSFAEKHAAEQVARRIRGVRAIAEEIAVRLPEHKKTADDEIASRVLKILDWGAAISDLSDIQVKVENGFVTLAGAVDFYFQRSAAEHSVRQLSGVTGIDNQLRIRPRMDVVDIRHGIKQALRRNAEIEAEDIEVEVSGNHVTLRGKVQSARERITAEQAAWSAKGVSGVTDYLTVSDK
ncbi:BON domain-containing protein (plasmid) [Ensifer sp. PDNC004]|uniref:BON domain-containing protein n=1 Tax=unclassified Ensifer TaxID=2633371 RepID=UPI00177CB253|nr:MULTISPECIES: BON domain-containing protein [unclassified Ensifer]MBD9649909.1 BON domain-containing protein [Ensifer sp. ENS09]QRY70518.1 BON domain-containing protein [Ensifer sp. PDNC004]